MTEITAVPIRPITKGSVTRLWIGIVAAVAVAGGLAWAGTSAPAPGMCSRSDFKGPAPVTTASGVIFQTLTAGTGPKPTARDYVLVGYKGMLRNKTVFDQSERAPMAVGGTVKGFSEALQLMNVGGKYRFCMPAKLGYGDTARPPIPANSALIFDVSLLDLRTDAEMQAMQQQMQQQGMAPPSTR
jgi:FKBP-type peptidyl-prolyl cis-trans isomerase FkpA